MPRPEIPVPSDRAMRVLKWVVIAAVMIALVGLVMAFETLNRRADEADRDRRELARANVVQDQTISSQADALSKANDRLKDAGEQPVTVPEATEPVAGPAGSTGPQGERGATGPRGPVGPAGESIVGPRGERGPRGFDGSDSTLPGPVGPAGSNGQQGPKGDPGEMGPAGVKGDTGATGDRGPAGEQGPRGEQGAPGPQGDPGPAGPAGPQGIPGVVTVTTSPACSDLLPNMSVSLAYDAGTQTLSLICQ